MTAEAGAPPPPSAATRLIGHEAAASGLVQAAASGRLGHGWLITGPRGIGKATLAYRIARYILAGASGSGSDPLHLDPDDPLFRRVAASAHPDLRVVERGVDDAGRQRKEITVDSVRALGGFFAMTPAEGGWRLAIIDAADEMNRNAANALLKLLEEPPPRGLLLLVCHRPGVLPPTIRSRCGTIKLRPLPEAAVVGLLGEYYPDLPAAEAAALARLAAGSPGRALELAAEDGLALYRDMLAVLSGLPRLDILAAHGFAERIGRRGREASFRIAMELLGDLLARCLVERARGSPGTEIVPGEVALREVLAARLDRGVELWENIGRLAERAERVNLDRKQVALTVFAAIEEAVRP